MVFSRAKRGIPKLSWHILRWSGAVEGWSTAVLGWSGAVEGWSTAVLGCSGAVVLCSTRPPKANCVTVKIVWPWSPPLPFPRKEGVCMGMITDPSPLQKRKVVSSHYHHHRSPLSDEKRTSGHDHLPLLRKGRIGDPIHTDSFLFWERG